jgi:hypothetical protein
MENILNCGCGEDDMGERKIEISSTICVGKKISSTMGVGKTENILYYRRREDGKYPQLYAWENGKYSQQLV